MAQTDEQLETALEALIDMNSLERVLNCIESVCIGKSEHILSSYSDGELSESWRRTGESVGAAAMRAERCKI